MPLFRFRNKAGTAQGQVHEVNPNINPFAYNPKASWNTSRHPAVTEDFLDKAHRDTQAMWREIDSNKELAKRMEKIRQSHGPDARW
jgi:hypothetical protein